MAGANGREVENASEIQRPMSPSRSYELPELGYEYDALEPAYSAELLELHHAKHHKAYVDGANRDREDLKEARRRGDIAWLSELQTSFAFNHSGHVLHSILWRNLAPNDGSEPTEPLDLRIRNAFGNLGALREQFSAAGAGIRGSGWAALAWDPIGRTLVVEQVHDHQGNTGIGTVPLMVMDMWEHAYYLHYRNEKSRWISAFWNMINWQDVNLRLSKVEQLNLGLGGRDVR